MINDVFGDFNSIDACLEVSIEKKGIDVLLKCFRKLVLEDLYQLFSSESWTWRWQTSHIELFNNLNEIFKKLMKTPYYYCENKLNK